MGFAFGSLHWSPDTFWRSTLREVATALASQVIEPAESQINSPDPFFNDEERAVLNEMKARLERDRRLAVNG